ncbi:MAG: hypothetical protein CMQ43_00420 [Gammaproteobacteria bacterium]|nr:hypothetical protein [Gammaproteobacteria bacterium]|tara:strand:- start:2255 stop:2725 length:471 start_codon:yes stop_codon:yes gene_type:complete
MRPAFGTLILLCTLLNPATAGAADDTVPSDIPPQKEADIQKLLAMTDSLDMGQQVVDQLLAIQQSAQSAVPQEVWDEIRAELDMTRIQPVIVAIWDRHFSHDDIRGLIEFYESPLGRKLVETQPAVMQESMAAGELWARQVLQRIQEKLARKGYAT